MQRRKKVSELKLSGKWKKLSRLQQAKRLLEEERGMPEGLSAIEQERWHIEQSKITAPAAAEEPPRATFDAANEAKAYAAAIVSGLIGAGRYHRQAAQRFLNDLDRADLIFDAHSVQHVCEYVCGICGLKLLPWQIWVLANVFGFKRKDGLRRFRFVLVEVAKKNGKTELAAVLSLYLADELGDGEANAKCYVAATTEYQSRSLCFAAARKRRENNSSLAARTRAFKNAITWGHSSFEALPANSEKLNGLNAHGIILDELGDFPTSDLASTLISATAGRRQPIIIAISTAGCEREQILSELRTNACEVLDGVIERDDLFAMICELDENDDFRDESTWIKANPSLDVLVTRDSLRSLMASAEAVPSTLRGFLRYHLNKWNKSSENTWLKFEDLGKRGVGYISDADKNLSPADRITNALRRLRGRRCTAGLDLAECEDESALCLLFSPGNEGEVFEAFFEIWIPEKNIERRSSEQRVPFDTWRDQHFVTATSGSTTDFDKIRSDIFSIHNFFHIRQLGFDPHLGVDILQKVRQGGILITAVAQGFHVSPAILRCEKLIKEGQLCIHGHPVATWNLSNCRLAYGSQGDVQFNRRRSREKIDAAASLVMAMDIFMRDANKSSLIGK